MNPEQRIGLPKVAFTGFASRFRPPTLKEGFEDIVRVDFEVSFGKATYQIMLTFLTV